MANPELCAELLILLLVANGAPIIARNLLGRHLAWPIDGKRSAPDGQRWLGDAKSWRGIVAGVSVTALTAAGLGYSIQFGAMLGVFSLGGDLLSSFIKRRMGLPSSARATGLDQLPEAILPLLVLRNELGLVWKDLLLVVLLFIVTELVLSRLLYHLRIRRRPY